MADDRTRASTDEPADPPLLTPHRPWTKVVALIVLGVFILATLVGALLV